MAVNWESQKHYGNNNNPLRRKKGLWERLVAFLKNLFS